ncbi:hypothetical protein J2752_000885 [Halarchaeum rubridurum]|uniref:Uncharacterized protein n=1 Tax=Halarchaeum rubridurum TaxID=489911 RepID=A0A8T4GPY6_9EURY|nr:hypothetical protein [Halarchaeum rubridurum]MBP1954004.1 hypothetical protein [Halarchaeum rubridurum]
MISRENRVIIVFGLLSLVVLYVMTQLIDLPTWAGIAEVIIVGVMVPQLINRTYGE